MDSYNYDPNQHLYQIFSTPESLDELPRLLSFTNSYKETLDQEIKDGISDYNKSYSSTLSDETLSFMTLIKEVKEKSAATRLAIASMTDSIQNLDQGKKNLVLSMTILKRLQMLINANNTLVTIIPSHNYKDILQLLSVIKELLVFFKPYKSIDEINQLNLMVNGTQNKLIDDIFIDFEDFLGKDSDQDYQLVYGCEILELIDLKYKEKLLTWFYNIQLKDIKEIFNNSGEAGSLDNLGRRYMYFNNTLKEIQSKYIKVFPKEWNIDLEICKIFCKLTNQDLFNLLKLTKIDSKTLLGNLMTTLEFEKSLNDIFKTNAFQLIISSVFEPYLSVWVSEQDKVLQSKQLEYMATSQLPPEFNENDDFMAVLKVNSVPNIANSCTELFKSFQRILTQILKLSNGEILLDLCKLFIRYLYEFHNKVLAPILPTNDEELGGGLEPLKYLTMLLNTGDYILNNIDDLSDKFNQLISDPFKSRLQSFENVKDVYFRLINKSISNLLIKVSNDLKLSWRQFINNSWYSMDSVSDVSSYLVEMKSVLVENLRVILPMIIRDSYIRNFNDKLVELLMNSFGNNLKLFKPVSIVNIEQILLDLSTLKELCLKFQLFSDANFDETKPTPNASSKNYQKFVNSQFHNLESLLKLLMIPTLPIETIIEKYFEMIGDKSIRNFTKFLNLKNIEKNEQRKYIENFKLQLTLDDGTLIAQSPLLSNMEDEDDMPTPTTTPTPSFKSPTILPTKINNFEKNLREFALNGENHVNKLNENFKNFGKFFRKDTNE